MPLPDQPPKWYACRASGALFWHVADETDQQPPLRCPDCRTPLWPMTADMALRHLEAGHGGSTEHAAAS